MPRIEDHAADAAASEADTNTPRLALRRQDIAWLLPG
jgi:hypothetical protein